MRYIITLLLSISFAFPAYAQISIVKNSDMDFGALEFISPHSGTLSLGTNDTLSASTSGISISGSPNAANILINASTPDVIEIKCENAGILSTVVGNGANIDIENIEANLDTGVNYGSGISCDGVKRNSNPVAIVDLSINPNPILLLGGQLVIPSNSLESSPYSTSAGGEAKTITVQVLFQ